MKKITDDLFGFRLIGIGGLLILSSFILWCVDNDTFEIGGPASIMGLVVTIVGTIIITINLKKEGKK